jgi:hypothetical protein
MVHSSVLEVVNAAKEVLKIILVKEKVMVKMKIMNKIFVLLIN